MPIDIEQEHAYKLLQDLTDQAELAYKAALVLAEKYDLPKPAPVVVAPLRIQDGKVFLRG